MTFIITSNRHPQGSKALWVFVYEYYAVRFKAGEKDL